MITSWGHWEARIFSTYLMAPGRWLCQQSGGCRAGLMPREGVAWHRRAGMKSIRAISLTIHILVPHFPAGPFSWGQFQMP